MQGRFALLAIELGCLLEEQCVNVRVPAVDVGTPFGDEYLKPGRCVTESPLDAWTTFFNPFSANALKKAARSSGLSLARMPTT